MLLTVVRCWHAAVLYIQVFWYLSVSSFIYLKPSFFFVFVKSQDFSWAKQDASEKNAHQFALSDEKHQEVCA